MASRIIETKEIMDEADPTVPSHSVGMTDNQIKIMNTRHMPIMNTEAAHVSESVDMPFALLQNLVIFG